MAAAGRPKKYKSNKALSAAVEKYFESISRTIEMQEKVETDEKDKWGKPIYETKVICNDAGEPIMVKQFLIPPSIGAMCLYLGISRKTWAEYCDEELNPEFRNTTMRTRARMENYLENELNSRSKGLQGIMFNLTNNYGWTDKKEVEIGERAAKTLTASGMSLSEKMAMLTEMAAEIRGDASEEDNAGGCGES